MGLERAPGLFFSLGSVRRAIPRVALEKYGLGLEQKGSVVVSRYGCTDICPTFRPHLGSGGAGRRVLSEGWDFEGPIKRFRISMKSPWRAELETVVLQKSVVRAPLPGPSLNQLMFPPFDRGVVFLTSKTRTQKCNRQVLFFFVRCVW